MLLLLPLVIATFCGPREELILFATGSTAVVDDGVLDWVAADLAPDDSPVCIEGAADGVGEDAANLDLGAQRAAAVADVLAAKGVARGRLVLSSRGEQGAPQQDDATSRRVVVRFTPRAPDAADVLDLPLEPAPPSPAAPPKHTVKRKPEARPPQPVHAWVLSLEPEWRRPASAAVVALGGACGAAVGLGLCCVAPWTATFGVSIAAGALDEAAEPDAIFAAGLGALLFGVGGVVATVAVVSAVRDAPVPVQVLTVGIAPASAVVGAAAGAAVGWWQSPSGRAAALEAASGR